MRILITGASGLLGLNLALEACKQHTVFGIVNQHPLHTNAFTVIQTDLLAPGALETLFEQTQPDWVIHCAALADLEACEADPALASQLNTELPRQLAHLCAQNSRHVTRGGARNHPVQLVHISTDAVFDGMRGGYKETDETNPVGVYSHTKLDAEQEVAAENPDAMIARVNLFGWSMKGTRSLAEFFFNNLSAGKQVNGFVDVIFCPLLANDLANLLLRMLELGLKGLYHVVGGECISKYDFGLRLAKRFGLDASLITPISVQQAGLKAARAPNLSLHTDKLTRALGKSLPGVSPALDRFYTLYQQGYPQMIRGIGAPAKEE
jgi:dTDP-4-dehydrorhamnose reductase